MNYYAYNKSHSHKFKSKDCGLGTLWEAVHEDLVGPLVCFQTAGSWVAALDHHRTDRLDLEVGEVASSHLHRPLLREVRLD